MRVALETMDAPRSLRIAARILGWPFKWLGLRGDVSQPPVVRALTALGPAYIKFGQLLSTRPDVVGPEMASELRVLQDRLPEFPTSVAKAEIEKELGSSIEELFTDFSDPVAAASLAQVHKATLRSTGEIVAVKVLRPGIEKAFLKDVDAFYFAASLIEKLAPSSRRLRPRAVIEHFAGIVQGELDLRMEASAADEFRANTLKDAGFRVPKLHWSLSSRRVMTMEWEDGVPFGDLAALQETERDLIELSERIMHMFLLHALRDGFFHADMHQGNLKLGPDGALIALDFGIMGRIDAYTRRVYAEILMGFLKKDYRRVAEVHFEAGYVPRGQDMEAFAQALRSVGEPIFGQEAQKISMARLLAHLFDVTERFGMETRTELILLQRTMVVVEGVGRGLNPALNIWDAAKPVVETYIRDNLGPLSALKALGETALVLARFGPRLPELVERALVKMNADEEVTKHQQGWPVWVWLLIGAFGGAVVVYAWLWLL